MSESEVVEVKKKGGRVCCVPNCKNTERKNPEIKFYSFPNRDYEVERKKIWINRVKRTPVDGKPWQPNITSRICSVHFVGGIRSNDPKKTAYHPSIFPWNPKNEANETSILAREKRFENRTKAKQFDASEIEESISIFSQTEESLNVLNTREISVQTDDIIYEPEKGSSTILFSWQDSSLNEASTQTYIPVENSQKSKVRIIEVQVPETKQSRTIQVGPDNDMRLGFLGCSSITNDKHMKQLAGITLSFFNILLQFIVPKAPGQGQFYKVLNAEDRLLLFLMKMKLGISFTALSCLFDIAPQTASKIFFEVLQTIYLKTKSWIFWPSKEAIKASMPASFTAYPNCRVIIDCTELRCETPPTVEQRALMYSTYKSAFTIKFLVGITPYGFISFISKGYGGRSSDSLIVNDCGFLKLIEPGDEVMADKGFPQIRSELIRRKSILIMPPFAVNPQFSREEVLEGYSIASVRIHVERCIQRIRIFKILDFVPTNLFPWIDKIMYVACVLANNKEPLIRTK